VKQVITRKNGFRLNYTKMAGDRPKTTCMWNFQHVM